MSGELVGVGVEVRGSGFRLGCGGKGVGGEEGGGPWGGRQ